MDLLNNNLQKLKNKVLFHVAKLSFEGRLNEEKAQIPFLIIPGARAEFRCCVHKERAILAERVKMASGKRPLGYERNNYGDINKIIYVINSACEECPISRFIVTDNCQNCLNKRCKLVCPFKAISVEGRKAYINQDLCRECGRCKDACSYSAIADLLRPCIKSCPVNAISVNIDKKAVIDDSKCIYCGNCMLQCPFGAISDISYIVNVIELLRNQGEIYAIIAPSIEGQFVNASLGMIKQALLQLGFKTVCEAATGADLIVWEEAEIFKEFVSKNEFMVSSCCPAFVDLIEKHHPKLSEHLSPSFSPMLNIAKRIKDSYPRSQVVFIGPCLAKKAEIIKDGKSGIIDYVLTFEELNMMFKARNINPAECPETEDEASSGFGRGVARSGGITEAVKEALSEQRQTIGLEAIKCNGVDECKKILLLAERSKISSNFIEGMVCKDGCIGGPYSLVSSSKVKQAIERSMAEAKQTNIKPTKERWFDGSVV